MLEPDRTAPGFARTRGDRLSWCFPSFFFCVPALRVRCEDMSTHSRAPFWLVWNRFSFYHCWCADQTKKPKGCRAKTSKIQLLCFELFHDSYCSRFSRDLPWTTFTSTSHLTSETIQSILTSSLGDLLDLGRKVVEAPTRFWVQIGGRDRRTGHRSRCSAACHGWKCSKQQPSRNSHFIHHFLHAFRCFLTKMFLKCFNKCYCCRKSSCHNVWDFCNPKAERSWGLAKNTVLRNYRDWIDKSTKQFYGAFWTCHKTAHKWKTCALYTFNSPCPLHCIYTLSHKSWSMSVRSHSTQRGRFIGWRQFLKTVASAHWKHPRTHSPWEDPPEHKSSSGSTSFSIDSQAQSYCYIVNYAVILLWYIAPSRQSHSTYLDWIPKAPQSTQGILEEKCGSPSSHSWDAQWTFRIRSMSTSMAWRKITHCAALNLTTPKRCLQLQVATSVRTFATARYAPFWWDVFLIQPLSVFVDSICSSVILCRDSFKYHGTERKCTCWMSL